ncbi:hypothetical protein [Amycolatopsis panacis]|uniref:DUF2029 domain-containing protein n=1 Tax=Amycolatopsis panacis TaxID=2340917 RepID=A0A419IA26_9PSEU|nr:hypothetical protein [Amycolatopsis panacis]RJQ89675.1 hypothetical protein D5S19_04305 [Amycolatopsis panacis]
MTAVFDGTLRRPRGTRTTQRIWTYLALTAVTLINVISHADAQREAHTRLFGDALNYYRMSEQTGAPVDNPFALRMLSPWLVHRAHLLTGLSLDTLWLALTTVTTLAAILVFFEFLWNHLRLQLFTAALSATALACTFWYALYPLSNIALVDPLTNLLTMIALWLALRGRLVLFTAVVIIGSVNKETTLLLAPLYPLLAWTQQRSLRDRQVLAGLAATLIAIAAYIGYRIWAQHLIGGNYGFGTGQANAGILDNIRFALADSKGNVQLAIFATFHFFWLIFAYGLYRSHRLHGLRDPLLVAGLWLFACCLAGRFLATDTSRVFVMLAPVVLAVVALTFDRHHNDRTRLWIGLLFAVYLAINFRWVPGPASLILDALATVGFAIIVHTGRITAPRTRRRPTS